MHMMGAAFLKVPELALSPDESKALGEAVSRVTEQYDVPLLDEKTRAWINLGMVAAGVYGPRIGTVVLRKKQERKRGPQPVVMPTQVAQ